jgi:N6-adenosine-specific RNA methylase IME4
MEEFGLRKRKQKKPSNSYYLGYVEDEETPEMIMMKFEQLEKLEKQNLISETPVLDEKAQEQLFSLTSSVLVQQSLSEAEQALSNFLEFDDENSAGIESSEDDDDYSYELDHTDPQQSRRTYGRKRNPIVKSDTSMQLSGKFIIQKKKIFKDPLAIEDVKLPDNPITIAWAKTIRPLEKYTQVGDFYLPVFDKTNYYECEDVSKFNYSTISPPFQGVLLHETAKLEKLPLKTIIPYGYMFIFIEKQNICTVIDEMTKRGFDYVENMAWVHQNLNGSFKCEKAKYLGKSHLTLFIFKKENPEKKMEIRHQRNPDTIFDFVKPMFFVYHLIETLIPNGRFLELYGEKNKKRENWHKIIEKNKYDF